jgi:hypothetical protein
LLVKLVPWSICLNPTAIQRIPGLREQNPQSFRVYIPPAKSEKQNKEGNSVTQGTTKDHIFFLEGSISLGSF